MIKVRFIGLNERKTKFYRFYQDYLVVLGFIFVFSHLWNDTLHLSHMFVNPREDTSRNLGERWTDSVWTKNVRVYRRKKKLIADNYKIVKR